MVQRSNGRRRLLKNSCSTAQRRQLGKVKRTACHIFQADHICRAELVCISEAISWAICERVLSINFCVYTLGAMICHTILSRILRIKSHSSTASSRATTMTAGKLGNRPPSPLQFAAEHNHQVTSKVNWNSSSATKTSGHWPAQSMKNVILLLTRCYQK